MTVEEFLNWLDENGLIITDWDLIIEVLNKDGIAIFDKIQFVSKYGDN